MKYQIRSSNVRVVKWFPTRMLAMQAFERKCKRAGIPPPLHYPPGVSGDGFRQNNRPYPHWTCAVGPRDGHGYVIVESRNDV